MFLVLLLAASPARTHPPKVRLTGAWDLPSGYMYHIDPYLARAIARLAGVNATIHDVGAGQGLYVNYWRSCGLRATGEDGVPNVGTITGGTVVSRDASTYPSECDPAAEVDLVTALEIAEHIPKKFEQRFLKHITCMASRILVLSWAHPGQRGVGHVNPATLEEVKHKMSLLDPAWTISTGWTDELRRSASISWFKRNVAVYVPVNATSALPSPRLGEADTLKYDGSAATVPRLRAAHAQALAAITELNATIAVEGEGRLASRAIALMHSMQKELARLPV